MATLLIVEDDRIIALGLRRQLTRLGHIVLPLVSSADEAIALVEARHPEVVLMDIALSGPLDGLMPGHGLQVTHHIPVIYLSGYAPEELRAHTGGPVPTFYLTKPVPRGAIAPMLERALQHAARQRLLQGLRQHVREGLEHTKALYASAMTIGQAVGEGGDVVRCRRPQHVEASPR
jgi:CheY-like chemotaxis protein